MTPVYGGGVLIFDEYGRLKYHVHNDVFGETRQAQRLKYLWETGQLEAGTAGGAAPRRTALDAPSPARDRRAQVPAEGW